MKDSNIKAVEIIVSEAGLNYIGESMFADEIKALSEEALIKPFDDLISIQMPGVCTHSSVAYKALMNGLKGIPSSIYEAPPGEPGYATHYRVGTDGDIERMFVDDASALSDDDWDHTDSFHCSKDGWENLKSHGHDWSKQLEREKYHA